MIKKYICLCLIVAQLLANETNTKNGYSLYDIIDMAYQNDLELQSSGLSLDAKREYKNQMFSYLLPNIDLTAKTNQYKTAKKYEVLSSNRDDSNQKRVGVEVVQPLYNKEKMLNYTTVDNEIEAYRIKYDITKQELLLKVIEKYLNLLKAQENITLLESEKISINEQKMSAKSRYDLGEGTILDVYSTQSKYDILVAESIKAQNDLQISKDEIAVLTNSYIESVTSNVKNEFVNIYLGKKEELLEKTLQNNMSILLSKQNNEVAKDNYEKSISRDLPTLDLVLGGVSDKYDGYNANADNYKENQLYIGLLFKMNLYSGGLTSSQQKEKLILLNQSNANVQYSQRVAQSNTYKEYLNMSSTLDSIKALNKAIDSTKLALESTEIGFKLGNRTSLDVLNTKHDLFLAKKTMLDAKYKLILSYFNLKHSLGELNKSDLDIFFNN